jgi:hypothetical protein
MDNRTKVFKAMEARNILADLRREEPEHSDIWKVLRGAEVVTESAWSLLENRFDQEREEEQ